MDEEGRREEEVTGRWEEVRRGQGNISNKES
jgi:hypothetical protein